MAEQRGLRELFSRLNFEQSDFTHYCDRLCDGEVYSTARFGDGEWTSILRLQGHNGRNCDGHRYYPQMSAGLSDILRSQPPEPFLLGMQHYGLKMFYDRIIQFLRKAGLQDLPWRDADTLAMHRSSVRNQIHHFFAALDTKPVIMVGPPHLRLLKRRKLVNFRAFVESPKNDAYSELSSMERKILKAYSHLKPPVVISISCGLPAGILCWQLFKKIGMEAFILDMGSVYDVYCGRASRSYQHTLRSQWAQGKGYAPSRIRAFLAKCAGQGHRAVREGSGKC